jgi:Protein of unknown function (DUF4435)
MNAMLACVDGAYIANQIRMLRSQDARAVLVVEGPTDELFFERLTDTGRCRIEVAHGRENAMSIFGELRRSDFTGALLVLDADFDVLEGRLPLPMGLLLTPTHDLETLLIASPALDKLLRQVGQRDKLSAFEQKHGALRGRLLTSGAAIGRLLWVSLRGGLYLRFDELKYGKFVNDKTLGIDERKMIKTVLDHSCRHDLDEQAIATALAELGAADHDPWHLCCGHHLTEILAIAFRKALASHNANEMPVEQVEHMLMLAYEAADFRSTPLHANIRTWEELNPPFVVLRSQP